MSGFNPEKPFYAIALTDGEFIYGEYQWMGADGPDDWTVAEEGDHDEPTEYVLIRMVPEVVNRRTFGPPPLDDDDEDETASKTPA